MASGFFNGESAKDGSLCGRCMRINFGRYCHANMSKIDLGKYGDIVLREHCSFCRLVVRALNCEISASATSLDIHDDVTMTNALSWELGVETSSYSDLRSNGYSNLYDLKSVSKKCRRPLYRFVVATRQNPTVKRMIQFLADPDREKGETRFFGRFVDPDHLPIALIRNWLDRCCEFHGNVCEEDGVAGRRLPDDLRLIDVRNRILIRAPARGDLEYITLSYVWGTKLMKEECGIDPVTTIRSHIRVNQYGQECTTLPQSMPKTIEDAMWLTAMLGYRYLWVDALCIVQDDPYEDKSTHLAKMDAIYNCSKITIVAASATHANIGLPGVSIPRHRAAKPEMVGSYEMAAMAPSFSELENCKSLLWNTRGWTFQEKVLAKRILFVSDYQVYFRCSESIWPEEAFMETDHPSKSLEARKAKYRWAGDRRLHLASAKLMAVKMFIPQLGIDDEWNYLGKFTDYTAAIHEYSQRDLENPDDALIAVNGILRTLKMDTGNFICGLPEAHLLQSLLWHADAGSTEVSRENGLPSWTWASWKHDQGVVFDILDIRFLHIMVLMIRKVMSGVGRTVARMLEPSGSSGSSSSSSDTSSSMPTTSSSSGSGTSSSTPAVPGLPGAQVPKRDWTTLNAMGKASANIGLCFSMPLLFQHHTIKHIFHYKRGRAAELYCEEPLSLDTLVREQPKPSARQKRPASEKTLLTHRKQASSTRGQYLAFKTTVVHFWTGECLSATPPTESDQCGVFELLNSNGDCVGEVWTTLARATKGREEALEFLSVSWGLTIQYAKIDRQWIPRWARDAKILPKSRLNTLFEVCQVIEGVMSWNTSKHLTGHYGAHKSKAAVQDQLSARSFFDSLLTAKKGDRLPPFLWSTVNMLLVEKDRTTNCYRRLGTGKVVFEAWLVNSASAKESVVLA